MKALAVYYACGLLWLVYNAYGMGEVSARYRDFLVRTIQSASAAPTFRARMIMRAAAIAGFVFSWSTWLIAVAWAMMPHSWTPKLKDRFVTHMRREIIDRPGLLKPQMPATRCQEHNVFLTTVQAPCKYCKREYDFEVCEDCRARSGRTDWNCPECPECFVHKTLAVTRTKRCTVCRAKFTEWCCENCKRDGVGHERDACYDCLPPVLLASPPQQPPST